MQIFRLQKMLKLDSLALETKADMTSHFRTGLRYFVAQCKLKEMSGMTGSHQANVVKFNFYRQIIR